MINRVFGIPAWKNKIDTAQYLIKKNIIIKNHYKTLMILLLI